MSSLPARTGWEWIKQGFALFRQQPTALITLLMGYMLVMLGVGLLPKIGLVLPIILIPVFSVAFMQACSVIDQGQRVMPQLLATGFRKPAFQSLFRLGLLYLLVAAAAIGATALVDGGVLFELLTGQLDPRSPEAQQAPLGLALMMALVIYVPAAMAFCFSAPLILWQGMGVGKAIFYSFFAVLRAAKAFVVFILSVFALTMLVNNAIVLLFGKSQAVVFVMLPATFILTLIMHCSFYASYRQIFGAPHASSGIDTTV